MEYQEQIEIVDIRADHAITLNPCRGCIHRGQCETEKYIEPGTYCRGKESSYAAE